MIMKQDNEPSLQEYSIIDFQKFKCYIWLSKVPLKSKGSEFFAINHDMQKSSF